MPASEDTQMRAVPVQSRPEPYISSSTVLPEITVKALVLGVLLSVVLASANTYVGLFAGMTVSASIPAAVISMAVLRLFRKHNILENNIVQTAASAGESLAAGALFTFPALLILGVWDTFHYWQVTLIAGLGGLLGVLFTVPLRRALIVERALQYPEGVATAEVLKSGENGESGAGAIILGGLAGAAMKLGATGFKLWTDVVEKAQYVGGSIAYFGSNLSPALVGVGYIVGLNIAVLVFIGGALNWLVAVPLVAAIEGIDPSVSAVEAAGHIWSTQTRYVGVGAMILGGIWALVQLRKSLWSGIRSGFHAYQRDRSKTGGEIERIEVEMPMNWVMIAIGCAVVPLFAVFWYITGSAGIAAFMAVCMLVAGFLFSAVASYMAGLVGSSNNPISGVTIATILLASLLLLGVLTVFDVDTGIGAAAAILIGSVVCCAAAIGGDNLQDLKAGYLLGATPRNQQWMQLIGVVSAAFVIAPVLSLLQQAYGIGVPTAAQPDALPAPQASLMASVAQGVFQNSLPWGLISIGMAVAVAVIVADYALEKKGSGFRAPVMAVAVGIYLPFQISVPILLGGLIAWAAGRKRRTVAGTDGTHRNGLLIAAGLITGEALMGIFLAIPLVVGEFDGAWPGAVLLAVVCALLYVTASKRDEQGAPSSR